jgi:hypothetical protein
VSVEIDNGKAVGVLFDAMHRPSETLAIAAKLPRLKRATYRHGSLTAAAIKPLASAPDLSEIIFDEPTSDLPQETIAALGELKALKRLTLRGVRIGEDEEFALRQRLPSVEVVLEPRREVDESGNATAERQVEVRLVW